MARPEVLYPLFATLTTLPGIGTTKARSLKRLDIGTVGDLLFLLPHGAVDRRLKDDLLMIKSGEIVTAKVRVLEHQQGRAKSQPYRVIVEGAKQSFEIIFFLKKSDWIERLLPVGECRIVSGKAELFNGQLQIRHPDFVITEKQAQRLPDFEPVYPLTSGINQKMMRKATQEALEVMPDLPEWQSAQTLQKFGWPKWGDALRMLHAPEDSSAFVQDSPARTRLAYDELLSNQLALGLLRARMRAAEGRITNGTTKLTENAKNAFGFTPTGAQVQAFEEIKSDMAASSRMLRLLQGDVGTGKTWVAMLAMLIAVEAGGQAALMAPTEILAYQHADNLGRIAKEIGVELILLTGRDTGSKRRDKLAAIENGSAQIVIGTHALFQRDITFQDLRLAVIDEQQRFGVDQRMTLAAKAPPKSDILMMTATPIPRTLALAGHGDMDFSILGQKLPGRQPVETRLISFERYKEIIERLSHALDRGLRAYWICPLIETAEDRHQELSASLGLDRVSLIHGKMSSEDKNAGVRSFQDGKTQLLVSTVVVEVGIHVPKATIMIIESAENFGLSQLHQLRGRVGRGEERSYCLLVHNSPLEGDAQARLEVMRSIEDGFRIAEEDLRIRGPGNFIGTAQSGAPKFRIADFDRDQKLMEHAHAETQLILKDDPKLASSRGKALRTLLHLMEPDMFGRSISET